MSRPKRRGGGGGEHEGPGMERWLLTYADLITLLMAFFVIMYAMSNVDAAKYEAMAQSLKVALGVSNQGPALIEQKLSGQKPGNDEKIMLKGKNKAEAEAEEQLKKLINVRNAKEEKQFAVMISKIKEYTKQKGIESNLEVKEDARGIVINLADKVLFETGKADLSPAAMQILDELSPILFSSEKHIKVEGHTDNVPINTDKFPSNWQLSTARATSVIMYWLGKYPDASDYLSAAGYGEHRPVASNDTPEGKAKNRRVEIIVLRDSISKGEPVPITEGEPANFGEELPEEENKPSGQ